MPGGEFSWTQDTVRKKRGRRSASPAVSLGPVKDLGGSLLPLTSWWPSSSSPFSSPPCPLTSFPQPCSTVGRSSNTVEYKGAISCVKMKNEVSRGRRERGEVERGTAERSPRSRDALSSGSAEARAASSGADVETERVDLPLQRAHADSQHLGGVRAVASRVLEGHPDQLALHGGEGPARHQAFPLRSRRGARDRGGEVLPPDQIARRGHQDAL